jgi:hypothetical protein
MPDSVLLGGAQSEESGTQQSNAGKSLFGLLPAVTIKGDRNVFGYAEKKTDAWQIHPVLQKLRIHRQDKAGIRKMRHGEPEQAPTQRQSASPATADDLTRCGEAYAYSCPNLDRFRTDKDRETTLHM